MVPESWASVRSHLRKNDTGEVTALEIGIAQVTFDKVDLLELAKPKLCILGVAACKGNILPTRVRRIEANELTFFHSQSPRTKLFPLRVGEITACENAVNQPVRSEMRLGKLVVIALDTTPCYVGGALFSEVYTCEGHTGEFIDIFEGYPCVVPTISHFGQLWSLRLFGGSHMARVFPMPSPQSTVDDRLPVSLRLRQTSTAL